MLKVRFNHDHRGPVLSFECAETPGWMIWEWIEGDELCPEEIECCCPTCEGCTREVKGPDLSSQAFRGVSQGPEKVLDNTLALW